MVFSGLLLQHLRDCVVIVAIVSHANFCFQVTEGYFLLWLPALCETSQYSYASCQGLCLHVPFENQREGVSPFYFGEKLKCGWNV